MTKPNGTALAVVSHALTGTVAELVPAHDQIAASMAQLQLNGFNTMQMCKAACWLAHGIGEHPAVFIQNHWAMMMKGRLMIEPKWEYMVRKLKETVPGFTFKVLIETDDCAKVEMSDGVDTHVVEYTIMDAKRQGLLGRGGAWNENTREMCFKQAVKRAARRIGVGRVSPWVDVSMEQYAEVEAEQEHDAPAPSEAVVVENGAAVEPRPVSAATPAAVASTREAGDGTRDSGARSSVGREAASVDAVASASSGTVGGSSPPAQPSPDPHAALSAALVRMYGKQPKGIALEKASLIFNELVKLETGTSPGVAFKRADEIAPMDATRITKYIDASLAKRVEPEGTKAGDPIVKEEEDPLVKAYFTPPPAEREPGDNDEDEPPPPESAEETLVVGDEYMRFMAAVKRAKKLNPDRSYVKEAPPGGGKRWMVDTATFSQAGFTVSQKVMVNKEVVMPAATLRQLTKILTDDLDAQERSRT